MAIIVQDEIMTDFGIALPNLIVSCQGVCSIGKITVNDVPCYRITSNIIYKTSNSAKSAKYDSISVDVSPEELDVLQNPFTRLYTELKTRFTNYTDCI